MTQSGDRVRDSGFRHTEIEPVYTGGMEGQRRAKRGETGSCCVRGGPGGSYPAPRVDLSTICDEHLCNVKVSIIAGIVQRSLLVLEA